MAAPLEDLVGFGIGPEAGRLRGPHRALEVRLPVWRDLAQEVAEQARGEGHFPDPHRHGPARVGDDRGRVEVRALRRADGADGVARGVEDDDGAGDRDAEDPDALGDPALGEPDKAVQIGLFFKATSGACESVALTSEQPSQKRTQLEWSGTRRGP